MVNQSSVWIKKGHLVNEISVPLNSTVCNRQSRTVNAFLPIPDLTQPDAVDICRKFGKDVFIAGNFETLEDFHKYYEGPSKQFYEKCGFYDNGRVVTWLPYQVRNEKMYHLKTKKLLEFPYHAPWWHHGVDYNCSKIYLKIIAPTKSISGYDCLRKVKALFKIEYGR